jgi:hypothetical protein
MNSSTPTAITTGKIGKKVIEKINACHYRIENMGVQLLEDALIAGELIAEAKSNLPHGEFMGWVKDNLTFSHRTATNYIRIYEAEVAGKLETVSNIGEAYKLIKSPPKITAPPAPRSSPSPVTIEAEVIEPDALVVDGTKGDFGEVLPTHETSMAAPHAPSEVITHKTGDTLGAIVEMLPSLNKDELNELHKTITNLLLL